MRRSYFGAGLALSLATISGCGNQTLVERPFDRAVRVCDGVLDPSISATDAVLGIMSSFEAVRDAGATKLDAFEYIGESCRFGTDYATRAECSLCLTAIADNVWQ